MIELEERLGAVLDRAADNVTPSPLNTGRPGALARRRQRNHRLVRAATVLLVLIGGVATVQRLDESSTTQNAAEGRLDEDGVPIDTGPVMTWREVDGPAVSSRSDDGRLDPELVLIDANSSFVTTVVWSGERFVALVPAEGGRPASLLGSPDGETWEPLPGEFPAGFQIGGLTASNGRLLIWSDPERDRPGARPEEVQILVSSDHGDAWQRHGTIAGSRSLEDDAVTLAPLVTELAAIDDRVVATVVYEPVPDLEATLAETPTPVLSSQLLSSDGGAPFEAVTERSQSYFSVVATPDRFYVMSTDADGGWQLRASEDGRAWTDVPTPGGDTDWGHDIAASGSALGVWTVGDVPMFHLSTDGATTWTSTEMSLNPARPSAGPGGFGLVGQPPLENPSLLDATIGWLASLGGQGDEPSEVIGWSADGEGWGWQPATEAFDRNGWPTITIGQDRVIAELLIAEGDTTEQRWFVAEIPE